MSFGDLIDGAIEPFSPAWAARRRSQRIGLAAVRQYDVATRGRRTKGWKRPATSADAENAHGIAMLRTTAGGRIVQGVEFDASNQRSAYWLFADHPGDVVLGSGAASTPTAAEHVDHVFERLRWGQTRGVSWLSSVAMTLRDVGDIEDAVRMQQKVQACLGLVLTPGEGQQGSPMAAGANAERRPERGVEALSPGMIFRSQPGETVQTINPTQSGGAVEFIRQQLAGVSANMAPYHLMTGDVSQANYSSLRAAMLGHWALLDDWQQNVIIPHAVRPAVDRRMARLALASGDKRFLAMKVSYALPVRRFVDPVKDLMGELIEIRSGLKLLSRSLAERGINAEDHLRELAKLNAVIDELGLALDSDPRRLTDSGVLQAATGYLVPKPDAAQAA
jgi:lambda family phage portal protein